MIDTINIGCQRPLTSEITQILKTDGCYENDNWSIQTTTKPISDYGPTRKKVCFSATHIDPLTQRKIKAWGTDFVLHSIALELPRMIYPTNGHMIKNGIELNLASEKLFELFDQIAARGVPWNNTFRCDVVMNLPVPCNVVLNCTRSIRAMQLRKPQQVHDRLKIDLDLMCSEIETLTCPGKEKTLCMYNKAKKEAKKARSHFPGKDCLRIELRLRTQKQILKFLGVSESRSVASFDYFHLYRCLRHVLCSLPTGVSTKEKLSYHLLLGIAMANGWIHNGIPIIELYRQSVNKQVFDRTNRKIASKGLSTLNWDWSNLLPKLAPPVMADVDDRGNVREFCDPTWGTPFQICATDSGFQLLPYEVAA